MVYPLCPSFEPYSTKSGRWQGTTVCSEGHVRYVQMKYVIFIDADCLPWKGQPEDLFYEPDLSTTGVDPLSWNLQVSDTTFFLCYIVSAHGLEEWGT